MMGEVRRTTAVAVLLSVFFAGCASVKQPKPMDLSESVCSPHLVACEAGESRALCRAAITCYEVLGEAMKCRNELGAAQELCAIDRAELNGEIDWLKRERWLWGVAGLVVGGLAVGFGLGYGR